MSVVNQHPHPRKHHTKQGHYILTASGKLLGFNNNRDKWNRMQFIEAALKQWQQLPASEKSPDIIIPPANELSTDPDFHTDPPTGGVVLKISTRILKHSPEGLAICTADDHDHPWGHLAAIDRMWIQKQEWDELISAGKTGGNVPDRIATRIARYHLLDFTRGEPESWRLNEIKKLDFYIRQTAPNTYQLSGDVLAANQQREFDAALSGKIMTTETGAPKQFTLTVLGDHRGDGRYTKGSRKGRNPLGIAFQLADTKIPENRIRPQASHWLQGYWEAEIQH